MDYWGSDGGRTAGVGGESILGGDCLGVPGRASVNQVERDYPHSREQPAKVWVRFPAAATPSSFRRSFCFWWHGWKPRSAPSLE